MKIDLHYIAVKALVDGYENLGYEGVVGYGGLLDIRPKFQREFIYDIKQRRAVIQTILEGFPLNVMYWSLHTDPAGGQTEYELLDGQQRTMSICEFVEGEFSVEIDGYPKNFDNLSVDDQNKILEYELMIYHCEGGEDEKLRWFEIINIAGETLKPQELRNAIYTGPWLTDAKRYFSRENQAAHLLSRDYVTAGEVDRQALLEKAIAWAAGKGDDNIKVYMNEHRLDPNAHALWTYFKNVVDWAKLVFPTRRSYLRSVPWNVLYEQFKDTTLDAHALEDRVKALMADDEVQKRSGIYTFVLTGDERALGLRVFTDTQKRVAYETQNGICPMCGEHFEFEAMDGDHILPWSKGGKTVQENCQMLCIRDNRSGS
ncbi:hypothetical protein BH09ACT7_BH09ACT7_23370 [soil metagenome]